MNWKNPTTIFISVLCSALLFFSSVGRAATLEFDEGVLTIVDTTTTLDAARLASFTAFLADNELELTEIVIDGGVINILVADGEQLFAVDVTLGEEGGKVDIVAGVTFQSGKITGGAEGDVLKIGDGTLQVGRVNMGGNFVVESGSVKFLDTVAIGGDVILKDGTMNFSKLTQIDGKLVIEKGNVTFEGSAANAVVRDDFILEEGTVHFEGMGNIFNSGFVNIFEKKFVVGTEEQKDEHGVVTAAAKEGNATLHGNTYMGTLIIAEGSTVSGVTLSQTNEDGEIEDIKPDLTIAEKGSEIAGTVENFGSLAIIKGGTVTGLLEDVDRLLVGDGKAGNWGEILTFEKDPAASLVIHTIGTIAISGGATLDIGDGVGIQLDKTRDTEESFDDLVIAGTLRVSSAATGIFKGNLDLVTFNHNLDPTYITVAGFADNDGNIVGGIVEIYKSEDHPGATEVDASTLHTQVIGIGQIIVESGVTFQSGTIKWGQITPPPGTPPPSTPIAGADVVVTGGGTYQAAAVDIGTGDFWVVNERDTYNELTGNGVTMEFLENITARKLIGEDKTHIIVHGNAVFEEAYIAGRYEGAKDIAGNFTSNLTLSKGGGITGTVAGINNFTTGGTLFLGVNHPDGPTVSTVSWTVLDPNTARIRTVGGTPDGTYKKVIQVTNGDSREALLGVLNASKSALYNPTWHENTTDNTFLDLELAILSVDDYVRNSWGKKGRNADNIGVMIEELSRLPQLQEMQFRGYLEGLSDAELRSMLRNALAGELASNAYRIAMHQPSQSVFRHLDSVAPLRSPFSSRGSRMRGQTKIREGFNVWFNPYGQAEHGKRDGDTFDGYNLARYGFYLGGDVEIYNRAVFGAFFGYGVPHMRSDLGKISANDYTGGLYLRMPTAWDVVVNMMIGFGSQDYTYKNSFRKTDFRGSSLFGSIELSRRFSIGPCPSGALHFVPLVALDFQSAKMDDFMVRDPILGGVRIEPEDLSSAILRVGLLGGQGEGFLRTRLQYMRQIAGDDVVFSRTSIGNLATTRVRGTQWGKDWLNVGIGCELWFLPRKFRHWRIYADYDFHLGKRTTSHLGSINTVLEW
ncbi:MAG: autotransporter outer membrane beta-barrel domain-containing protein [Planctomycetaceae bacterium]|nr:autotransporter outer membrane beta-barrel domain-containing protein [Planctomycetaceae bacterium]